MSWKSRRAPVWFLSPAPRSRNCLVSRKDPWPEPGGDAVSPGTSPAGAPMRPLVLAFALALSAAAPGTALAAHSYDGCKYTITTLPAVLTTQGTWCLKGDLATGIT